MKISELPLSEEVRKELIHKVMSRREASLPLYCWENKKGVAVEAFFSKHEAIKDWYIKNRLWQKEEIPKGVLLYEWTLPIKTIIDSLKDGKLHNLPIAEEHAITVELPLKKLHEELQQTVHIQG